MIKAVCMQRCYVHDGHGILKIRYPGDICEFKKDKVDVHFKAIEGSDYQLDFRKASEAELLETKWKLSDAKVAMKEFYDIDLNVDPNDSKQSIVNKILDIRYRATK